jgi:N-methylhydantoinase A
MANKRQVRIGIDVGGTFTDAVAIDSEDYSVISYIKTPTTHSASEGVARGVIDSLVRILEKGDIDAEEVNFIAHGTTQATNALLEGDVADVGIIGMGQGIEGIKAKADTNLGNIEVSQGKILHTESAFINTTEDLDVQEVCQIIKSFLDKNCEVIVASEAFSVDDPVHELTVQQLCRDMGIQATGGHEISKLYGLRARTKTAAINASILPKMMKTANMTQDAVNNAKITAPLMIMRCDGGVMKMDEVKKRPILTMLSGPAAGVAGALMYERVSDGIFLEVGGTSTDISAIKNGKVMIKYAQIGGNKTYITSLDVRTLGIGGGSMVRVSGRKVIDVGPRSAHIAGCGYCAYAEPEVIAGGKLEIISPLPSDPREFAIILGTDGKRYAITLSCAANFLNYVRMGDYAYGSKRAAEEGLKKLAEYLSSTPLQVAKDMISITTAKVSQVVKTLIKDYELDTKIIVLTGGGGGASCVLWPLSEALQMNAQIAKNAPIISTIGAALAMVRDVVERTIINPSEDDILHIRTEAEHKAIEAGANPTTIEVSIEIDSSLNRVRAIAMGTTELVRKSLGISNVDEKELWNLAAKSIGTDPSNITLIGKNSSFCVFSGPTNKKSLFSFLKGVKTTTCVLDLKGIVKLSLYNAVVRTVSARVLKKDVKSMIKEYAVYDESGERVPDIFLLVRGKIIDLKGLPNISQLAAIIETEAKLVDDDQDIITIAKAKK